MIASVNLNTATGARSFLQPIQKKAIQDITASSADLKKSVRILRQLCPILILIMIQSKMPPVLKAAM